MDLPRFCTSCNQLLPGSTALAGLCPACLIRGGFYSGTSSRPQGAPAGFSAPSVEELAGCFPHLEVLELIGQGGMGAVYKARQPRLDRIVALKILAGDAGSGTPRFAERFLREARALAQLNHPSIVTVHDFGETNGLYYLLMEYIDGLNLRQLQRSKKLSPEEALAIVPPICEALQYAHSLGIVHRDIKPENILLDKNGRVKLADFGIAKILGSEPVEPLTGDQQRIGTPNYMAPEQVEKPTLVDHRADIYSLGVVIYEMLTGELPLGRFAPPSRKVQVDVRLDEIVLRALEKEPDLRYQQVSEIQTEVESLKAQPKGRRHFRSFAPIPPPPAKAPVAGTPVPPHMARTYRWAGAAVVAGWGLVGAAIGIDALVKELKPRSIVNLNTYPPPNLSKEDTWQRQQEIEAFEEAHGGSLYIPDAIPLNSSADTVVSTSTHAVTLPNGFSMEVAGACRNPRQKNTWWKPDGTLIDGVPFKVLEMPAPERGINPENEFLVYIREKGHLGRGFSVSQTWVRRTEKPYFPPTVEEQATGERGNASLLYYFHPDNAVTYMARVPSGQWEKVAIYDGSKTRELVPGVMVVCSRPAVPWGRKDIQFEIMHNIDREKYALRMTAKLKNGEEHDVVMHSGVTTGNPAKGFAVIWPHSKGQPDETEEYIIERSPLLTGVITNIALEPKLQVME